MHSYKSSSQQLPYSQSGSHSEGDKDDDNEENEEVLRTNEQQIVQYTQELDGSNSLNDDSLHFLEDGPQSFTKEDSFDVEKDDNVRQQIVFIDEAALNMVAVSTEELDMKITLAKNTDEPVLQSERSTTKAQEDHRTQLHEMFYNRPNESSVGQSY